MQRDFGPNLFSLYNPNDPDPIFQIDANLGYPGAVIVRNVQDDLSPNSNSLFQNAIVQALDVPSLSTPLTITLLPALPAAWSTGSVNGLRVRGGLAVNVAWRNGKATSGSVVVDRSAPRRSVQVVYQGRKVAAFATEGGKTISLNF